MSRNTSFACCLVEGLVAKGKCYSAVVQMLGMRSVIERLAQFLLNIGELYGEPDKGRIVVHRTISHGQIASLLGATRQWVTITLEGFRKNGINSITRRAIIIEKLAAPSVRRYDIATPFVCSMATANNRLLHRTAAVKIELLHMNEYEKAERPGAIRAPAVI